MLPDFPPEFPEAARAHVRWIMGRWGDPDGRLDDPQFTEHCTEVCGERAGIALHRIAPLMAPYTLLGWSVTRDGLEALRMRNAKGMDADLCFRFGLEPEFKLSKLVMRPVLPPTVTARLAAGVKQPALDALQRNCPIQLADGREIIIEHGRGFYQRQALAGRLSTAIATVNGEIAAMMCSTITRMRYDGRPQPFTYLHHLRVLPAMRKAGLFQLLSSTLFDRLYDDYRYICSLVHRDNARARELSPVEPWSETVERIGLPCDGVEPSAAPLGRTASAADLPALVRLFNATHARAAMFEPYTEETLGRRLGIEATHYSFSDILMSDNAAVGLWRWSDSEKMAGSQQPKHTGLIVDYAADGDAGLSELPRLLREAQSLAARRGLSTITLITSPRAHAYRAVHGAGPTDVIPFIFNGPPERPGLTAHGVHLDNAMI